MSERFSTIWYATHDRLSSMTKFVVFSDSGGLEVWADEMLFRGRRYTFPVRTIATVELRRQTLPWVSYVVLNALGFFFLAVKAADASSLLLMVGVLALLNVLGMCIGYSTKWVMVEFTNEQQQPLRAYFADGSLFGWGGIFGGTAKLYAALKPLAPASREPSSVVR